MVFQSNLSGQLNFNLYLSLIKKNNLIIEIGCSIVIQNTNNFKTMTLKPSKVRTLITFNRSSFVSTANNQMEISLLHVECYIYVPSIGQALLTLV